jgi:SAM-dependent methyltransferase
MAPSNNAAPIYGSSEHYLDKAGEKYFAAQRSVGILSAQWNLSIWLKYLDVEDSILDVGCGSGALLALLPGKQKVGVEINPSAREYAESLGLMVFSDLDSMPPQKYTKIISSHALEHIPHPLILLRKLRDNLDTNGRLLFLLPLDDWRARENRNYNPGNIHRHLYNWTPQNIGNLFEESGFSSIHVEIITDAIPPKITYAEWLLTRRKLKHFAGKMFSLLARRRQLFVSAGAGI